jgi:hypothetical protein
VLEFLQQLFPAAMRLHAAQCLALLLLALGHQQLQGVGAAGVASGGVLHLSTSLRNLRGGAFGSSNGSGLKGTMQTDGAQYSAGEHRRPWWLDSKGKWTRRTDTGKSNLLDDPVPVSVVTYEEAWWEQSLRGKGGKKKRANAPAPSTPKPVVPAARAKKQPAASTDDGVSKYLAAIAVPTLLMLLGGSTTGASRSGKGSLRKSSPKSKPKPKTKNKPAVKPPEVAQKKAAPPAPLPPPPQPRAAVAPRKAKMPAPAGRWAARLKATGILLSATLILGGLSELNESNSLMSSWDVPYVEPWQVLTAGSFFTNMLVLRQSGNPGPSGPPRLFAPAAWAFSIWGPIFLGELAYVLYQLLPSVVEKSSWWLAKCSVYFSATMAMQSLWCFAFRPWATVHGFGWISALLLGIGAVSLSKAHNIITSCALEGDLGLVDVVCAYIPIALHFGWLSAAALVNSNGALAARGVPVGTKLSASVGSVFIACAVGCFVGFAWRDPIVPAVVAWALTAIADERGYRSVSKVVDGSVLETQTTMAKSGATLMKVVSVAQVGRLAIALFSRA